MMITALASAISIAIILNGENKRSIEVMSVTLENSIN
jgi:hypothetical protein